MQHPLVKQFLEYNRQHKLFGKKEFILLTVSGGADSMVLFELFADICVKWELKLAVLHYNHQLRSSESDADEQFVRKACAKAGIPFFCGTRNVSDYAAQTGKSLETAARKCRYTFFDKMAEKLQADKIATAHNKNDQAETVLDRICRGTGIHGLAGIPRRRGLYIRPLLFAERSEIIEFTEVRSIAFRTDHSNHDISFKRNRIRHILLPLLQKEFNPEILSALSNLSSHAEEADNYMQSNAQDALKSCQVHHDGSKIILDIERFLTYLKSLQKIMLRFCFIELGHDPNLLNRRSLKSIEQFLLSNSSSGRLEIGSVSLYKNHTELFIGELDTTKHQISLPSATGCFSLWNGYTLQISELETPPALIHSDRMVEYIDKDLFTPPFQVRSFKASDRFYPVNGRGSKTVSDFFIDHKINRYERSLIPILECSEGIVWICGYRLDDRFKVSPSTTVIIKLELYN